jgi:hypothetical protein
MALSDEGTVQEFEMRAELMKLSAKITELERSQETFARDLRDLAAFVKGNRDMGATGLAAQMEHIANDVREIKARITQQDVEAAQQRKVLGVLGFKDLPTVLLIILTLVNLAKGFGLW